MAHFCNLNSNNVVTAVLIVPDEQETRGHDYLTQDCGLTGKWVQTSYNTKGNEHLLGGTPFRYNFGQVGSFFDETVLPEGAFILPKPPFDSWILDKSVYVWKAPVPYPVDTEDGNVYTWNEDTLSWVPIIP